MKDNAAAPATQALTTEVAKFESPLAELKHRTDALAVTDQESFVIARTIQKDWDGYIKQVGFELDPGIAKAKSTLDHLKDQKEKYVGPAKQYKELARQKADAWAAEEKRLARIEEDRKNAELRKQQEEKAEQERKDRAAQAIADRKERVKEIQAMLKRKEITKAYAARLLKEAGAEEEAKLAQAEADAEAAKNAPPPQVTVKPSIPTVAGTKSQTFYFAEVYSPDSIIDHFLEAFKNGDMPRCLFLRQFISVNTQEVGVFARKMKDNEAATKQLPGVKFTSRG